MFFLWNFYLIRFGRTKSSSFISRLGTKPHRNTADSLLPLRCASNLREHDGEKLRKNMWTNPVSESRGSQRPAKKSSRTTNNDAAGDSEMERRRASDDTHEDSEMNAWTVGNDADRHRDLIEPYGGN